MIRIWYLRMQLKFSWDQFWYLIQYTSKYPSARVCVLRCKDNNKKHNIRSISDGKEVFRLETYCTYYMKYTRTRFSSVWLQKVFLIFSLGVKIVYDKLFVLPRQSSSVEKILATDGGLSILLRQSWWKKSNVWKIIEAFFQ